MIREAPRMSSYIWLEHPPLFAAARPLIDELAVPCNVSEARAAPGDRPFGPCAIANRGQHGNERVELCDRHVAAQLNSILNVAPIDWSNINGEPDSIRRTHGVIRKIVVPAPVTLAVVDAFLAKPWTAVHGFHGAGKDAVLCALMLYAAYCEGMLVLAISATERQLTGQLLGRSGRKATKIGGTNRKRGSASGSAPQRLTT